MKKFLMAAVFMGFMLFTCTGVHAQGTEGKMHAQGIEGKMGYLDLSRVFDEYQKTKEYDSLLEDQHSKYEKERNEKVEKLKSAQEKLALLKEDEKVKLETDIETQKNELLEFDRQMKTDLTKQRDEKIREILLEIEGVVKAFAEKEKYSLILNDRVLIYGDKVGDITEPILKTLNESYAKTTTDKTGAKASDKTKKQ